jgi:hypothetical protein
VTTINPQIDAAVVLMKARAAEFDHTRTMSNVALDDLMGRAYDNLTRALTDRVDAHSPIGPQYQRRQLVDTMNLCALALSVLPKGGS